MKTLSSLESVAVARSATADASFVNRSLRVAQSPENLAVVPVRTVLGCRMASWQEGRCRSFAAAPKLVLILLTAVCFLWSVEVRPETDGTPPGDSSNGQDADQSNKSSFWRRAYTNGFGLAAPHYFEPAVRVRFGVAARAREELYDARVWAHVPLFDNLMPALRMNRDQYAASDRDGRWAWAVYGHMEYHVRQEASDSKEVSPGYRPGISASLFHVSPIHHTANRNRAWATTSRVAASFFHYSNGQDRCAFNSGADSTALKDCNIDALSDEPLDWNITHGSFSTNYVAIEADVRFSRVDVDTGRERQAFQFGGFSRLHFRNSDGVKADQSDILTQRLYGLRQFGGRVQYWQDASLRGESAEYNAPAYNAAEKWGRLGATLDVMWFRGRDGSARLRRDREVPGVPPGWALHAEVSYTWQKLHGLGFSVYSEAGRDPLNIRFLESNEWTIGGGLVVLGREPIYFRRSSDGHQRRRP